MAQSAWTIPSIVKTNSGWETTEVIQAGVVVLREAPLLKLPYNHTSQQLFSALEGANIDWSIFPRPILNDDSNRTIFEFYAVKFGDEVGLFRVASRLSRSYTPNLSKYWNGQFLEYRASRCISTNEELVSPPFSVLAILQNRCLRSNNWHTIQPQPECQYCTSMPTDRSQTIRSVLDGILHENELSLDPEERISQIERALQFLVEERIEYFKDKLLHQKSKAHKELDQLNNAMLSLREAKRQSRLMIGPGDRRLSDLVREEEELEREMQSRVFAVPPR
ncbi:hypothetical protein FRC18_003530 [Serendipita sp. 400]|nr:hypothetical protein FRC18_003530 [Serendipita sp. 400]